MSLIIAKYGIMSITLIAQTMGCKKHHKKTPHHNIYMLNFYTKYAIRKSGQ